jgi:SAM-dependent methyltransferase
VCRSCGTAQAVISPKWEDEARRIYGAYAIYHQSGGAEQTVFDPATGAAAARSSRLLGQLQRAVRLPAKGRLLDVGCGNGSTLRAFREIAPDWRLAGLEVSERYKSAVESIPGVERLYTGNVTEVPGEFDVITLIHALEHIQSPTAFLAGVVSKLSPDGILVVQVPDCNQNAFMYLVADHATHFFPSTLDRLITAAGYDLVVPASNWIAKELTVVARKGKAKPRKPAQEPGGDEMVQAVEERVKWLLNLTKDIREIAGKQPFGILGTSIAATWLQGELNGAAAFFVDEDPNRVDQTFMERPVLRTSELRPQSIVVVALPMPMAESVRARLHEEHPEVEWWVPAPLGDDRVPEAMAGSKS